MSDIEICEFCQTEIVWDPEIGREEMCPHCLNMLRDYRKLDIPVDAPEAAEEADEPSVAAAATNNKAPQTHAEFEKQLQAYSEAQQGGADCSFCHEMTVKIGTQLVQDFKPFVPAGFERPLIKAPFELEVYLCPTCKQVQMILPDKL